jgi:hypothetical protein
VAEAQRAVSERDGGGNMIRVYAWVFQGQGKEDQGVRLGVSGVGEVAFGCTIGSSGSFRVNSQSG